MAWKTIPTFLFTFLVVGVFALPTFAQDSLLDGLYGRGVHAYFSGNYAKAQELFTKAIDGGIKDPRAYYFRGMSAHCSGRAYEAESDWQLGAETYVR